MKKIICLYGAPACGKSTACAEVFALLKKANFNCEMNREYIKEWVWENRQIKEGDQSYFFAKQARKERLYIMQGIQFIITDSPLLLTHFYGLRNDPMEREYNTSKIMLQHHHGFCKKYGYTVDHYVLSRQHTHYEQSGRLQTEEEAKMIDFEIVKMLDDMKIKYQKVTTAQEIVSNYIHPSTTNNHVNTDLRSVYERLAKVRLFYKDYEDLAEWAGDNNSMRTKFQLRADEYKKCGKCFWGDTTLSCICNNKGV